MAYPSTVVLSVTCLVLAGCDDTATCYEAFYHDSHVHRFSLVSVSSVGNNGDDQSFLDSQTEVWGADTLRFEQSAYGGWMTSGTYTFKVEEPDESEIAVANLAMDSGREVLIDCPEFEDPGQHTYTAGAFSLPGVVREFDVTDGIVHVDGEVLTIEYTCPDGQRVIAEFALIVDSGLSAHSSDSSADSDRR